MNKTNRAVRFYYEKSENIYDASYTAEYGLDEKIKPIHNPIKPAVQTLCSLSLQQVIEHNAADRQKVAVDDLWKNSGIQTVKYQLMIDLLLYRYAAVWINKDNLITRLNPSTVTYEKEAEKLLKVAITGERKEFVNGVLKVVPVKRVYYQEGNNCFVIDNDEKPLPIIGDVMPVTIIETGYDLEHLLDITDDINEKRAWLRNIYKMHGNAILNLQQGGKPATGDIEVNNGYNFFQSEGVLKYVEMQGNVAQQISNDINVLKEDQAVEYPESALSRVLTGSNISENTSKIRFADLESKVNRLRGELSGGLVEITNKALTMAGKGSVDNLAIKFEDIFPKQNNYDDETKIADLAVKYKELSNQKLWNEYRARVDLPLFDDGDDANGSEWQDFVNN